MVARQSRRMMTAMPARWFSHLFFVLYCAEAGIFLVLAPWSLAWERLLLHFPIASLHALLLEPAVRGAITGFGLVHLVWGAHDLDFWLARRRHPERLRS